eukprot:gene51-60_t
MGDKTQLLALVLALRFRQPWPIVWGILVATLLNHALAGAVGAWVTTLLGPDVLRWVLGTSFLAMAAWMLVPDKLDEGDTAATPRFGVFGTTWYYRLDLPGVKEFVAAYQKQYPGMAIRVPGNVYHNAYMATRELRRPSCGPPAS